MNIQLLEDRHLLSCLDATVWSQMPGDYSTDYDCCATAMDDGTDLCNFMANIYSPTLTLNGVAVAVGSPQWRCCLALIGDYIAQASIDANSDLITSSQSSADVAAVENLIQNGINADLSVLSQCYASFGSLASALTESLFADDFSTSSYPCSNSACAVTIDALISGQNNAYNLCQILINAGWITSCSVG